MIDLKILSAVAAAGALLAFSAAQVNADTINGPLQLAQSSGSMSPDRSGSGSGTGGAPSSNPSAMPGSGSSPLGSGSTARGMDQCAQISDPRARQDCIQRYNDMHSGGSGGNRGATGTSPMDSSPGTTTNPGSGPK